MSPPADAFNGKRTGFMLGFGVGGHVFEGDFERGDHRGLATVFRLGFGLSEQLQLFIVEEVSWFKRSGDSYFFTLDGAGARFYFSPTARSFYLNATIGLASISDYAGYYDGYFINAGKGPGLSLGAGFEIRKHFNIETSLIYSDIEAIKIVNRYDAMALHVLLGFNFY